MIVCTTFRFTSSESGVLVASDVAARGLDLPEVQHVIHYQVPRNTEVNLHCKIRVGPISLLWF